MKAHHGGRGAGEEEGSRLAVKLNVGEDQLPVCPAQHKRLESAVKGITVSGYLLMLVWEETTSGQFQIFIPKHTHTSERVRLVFRFIASLAGDVGLLDTGLEVAAVFSVS